MTKSRHAWVTAARRSTVPRALANWRHFDLGWVDLLPTDAGIAAGTTVAVLVRHLGFWSLSGCRVVYALGGLDQDAFGFAYGTLVNHAESGEEIFSVRRDPATDDVSYVIRAASQPRALAARLGRPIVRSLQARFRRDSVRAMRGALNTSVRGESVALRRGPLPLHVIGQQVSEVEIRPGQLLGLLSHDVIAVLWHDVRVARDAAEAHQARDPSHVQAVRT